MRDGGCNRVPRPQPPDASTQVLALLEHEMRTPTRTGALALAGMHASVSLVRPRCWFVGVERWFSDRVCDLANLLLGRLDHASARDRGPPALAPAVSAFALVLTESLC